MDTLKQLKDELTEEYQTTKKFIAGYPEGKNSYAPHDKSMKLADLTNHVVNIFGWPELMFTTSELDMAQGEAPEVLENAKQLQARLDENYKKSLAALDKAVEADLEPTWSLKMNGQTLMEWTKYGAIRHSLNQITHHRAQMGVYYRLMDIPVPGSYGPSADDQSF